MQHITHNVNGMFIMRCVLFDGELPLMASVQDRRKSTSIVSRDILKLLAEATVAVVKIIAGVMKGKNKKKLFMSRRRVSAKH